MRENLISALEEIGYKLKPCGHYYSTNAIYRNGQNPTALTIYPEKNLVIDWVTGQKFQIEDLVKLTLGFSSLNQTEEWLKSKNVVIKIIEPEEPKLQEATTFPLEWVNKLVKEHSYWLNRGIKKEVLEELKGGIATEEIPRMKGRYCFPIIQDNKLVGMAGRSLIENSNAPKWKLLGQKKVWIYPTFLNHDILNDSKKVLLVESIGNCLALWQAGYKNIIVMFGVDLSFEIVNYLLKYNLYKLTIATDNDERVGKEAAEKIYRKLGKWFDKKYIKISLPWKKDFAEQSLSENSEWISKCS